ncbi:hypothetical protein I6A60_20460 [Frankia sp. AgB1.9]|uniref:hypothetical protein n=1 Tax=unclassified Frankia TaxID=2632575 RepID=UPI001932A2C7|nr:MULTISPECIES: hypothetical protein [unclassified Frankia]MBL7489571.1 hypothetical protein [Frankia sp. AgW1.1]MBL7550231.1 hypothetical protein [Frankia sp. AgB1.9]MBL7619892.1 hypothetical protein [Frankia sp. AgB1.8]
MIDVPLVRAVALPGSGYGLEVLVGATPGEIASVASGLPPAAFVSHLSVGGGVNLLFRRFPAGVPDPAAPAGGADDGPDAVTVAPGWVPQVVGFADRGLTPYQVAVGLLMTATDDPAIAARIYSLVQREEPETMVALGSVVRPRNCRCTWPG